MTNNIDLNEAMKNFPNAIKVADGWLIENNDGTKLHLFGVYSKEMTDGLSHAETFYLPSCTREEILRIRDLKTAADHLLLLRADAIASNPRFVRVFRARIKKQKNWSLTKWYANKEFARDAYLNALSRNLKQKVAAVPAGMALLKDVNAACYLTEQGNYIAVSEALENFLYFMNLALYGDTFNLDIEDQMSALVIGVRTMLGSESIDFDLDPRGDLPAHIDAFINKITQDQISFVFGHEYSHHLLNHLQNGEVNKISLQDIFFASDSGNTINAYAYKHKKEYQADLFSIKNIKSNTSYKSRLANAAFLMFSHFSVLNHVFEVMAVKSPYGSSHPKPLDRMWKLRRSLNKKIGMSSEELNNILKYSDFFKNILAEDLIPYHYDKLENYGSHYLPGYKENILKDRIDF